MTSLSTRSIARFSGLFFVGILIFGMAAVCAVAQSEPSETTQLQDKIRDQLAILHANEQAHASDRDLGYRWAVLGMEYANAGEFTNSENAYTRALQLLGNVNPTTSIYADVLDQMGALYRIYGRLPEALNCRRKALALRQQMGDPLDIARSQSHLAELDLMARKFKEAARGADQAYQSMLVQEDPNQSDLTSALIVLAYAHCALHQCAQGLAEAQQALAISRKTFPADSMPVGAALVAVGFAQLKTGAKQEAGETTEQAVSLLKSQLAPADPRLTHAMEQYRNCLLAMRRKPEAEDISAQLSGAARRSSQSCPGCTVSTFGLRSQTP